MPCTRVLPRMQPGHNPTQALKQQITLLPPRATSPHGRSSPQTTSLAAPSSPAAQAVITTGSLHTEWRSIRRRPHCDPNGWVFVKRRDRCQCSKFPPQVFCLVCVCLLRRLLLVCLLVFCFLF